MNEQIRCELLVETMRKKLHECGVKKGFSHKDTVRISEQLDQLLNQYIKITMKN